MENILNQVVDVNVAIIVIGCLSGMIGKYLYSPYIENFIDHLAKVKNIKNYTFLLISLIGTSTIINSIIVISTLSLMDQYPMENPILEVGISVIFSLIVGSAVVSLTANTKLTSLQILQLLKSGFISWITGSSSVKLNISDINSIKNKNEDDGYKPKTKVDRLNNKSLIPIDKDIPTDIKPVRVAKLIDRCSNYCYNPERGDDEPCYWSECQYYKRIHGDTPKKS